MEFISVSQFAEKFGISERTARNYCASEKIGTCLTAQDSYKALLDYFKIRY